MVETVYRLSLSAELSIVVLVWSAFTTCRIRKTALVCLVLLCASPPSLLVLEPAMSVDFWAVGSGYYLLRRQQPVRRGCSTGM